MKRFLLMMLFISIPSFVSAVANAQSLDIQWARVASAQHNVAQPTPAYSHAPGYGHAGVNQAPVAPMADPGYNHGICFGGPICDPPIDPCAEGLWANFCNERQPWCMRTKKCGLGCCPAPPQRLLFGGAAPCCAAPGCAPVGCASCGL